MLELINLYDFLYSLPTIWELYDDRHGETADKKKKDVFIRIGISILVGVVHPHATWWTGMISSLLFFGLTFDYAYNLIIMRRKDWFTYLGQTAKMDKWSWWRNMNPWARLGCRVGLWVAGTIVLGVLKAAL